MKSLPERFERLVASLEALDRGDRIQTLVDIAKRFRQVPPHIADGHIRLERRVPGCESEVYIWTEPRADGTLTYHFAVENPQGISAMASRGDPRRLPLRRAAGRSRRGAGGRGLPHLRARALDGEISWTDGDGQHGSGGSAAAASGFAPDSTGLYLVAIVARQLRSGGLRPTASRGIRQPLTTSPAGHRLKSLVSS